MVSLKKYQCHLCDRKFFTAQSRSKHEKGFHNDYPGHRVPKRYFRSP